MTDPKTTSPRVVAKFQDLAGKSIHVIFQFINFRWTAHLCDKVTREPSYWQLTSGKSWSNFEDIKLFLHDNGWYPAGQADKRVQPKKDDVSLN